MLQKGVCVASVGPELVCKESVCRACLNFICKGRLFASVGPELMCKESVYRACLNFICCQNYSAKLVSLIANPSWFILLLGNVRPELHTEYASFLVLCLTTYSLMYYSYVTYFEIIWYLKKYFLVKMLIKYPDSQYMNFIK